MRRSIGGHANVARVVLVAVMGLSLASCQWVNGLRADQSIELAHRLFQTGHFVQAAAQYEDVLTGDPTRVEAHHFLAISYDRQYERAFALDDDKERLLRLAEVERALTVDDDYVEALRYKDTLLRMRAQLTVDAGAAAQMVVEANLARDRAAALQ